nr:vegetative cell wall protein gp1-like [Aegilops tauschii subsp. strangulata]
MRASPSPVSPYIPCPIRPVTVSPSFRRPPSPAPRRCSCLHAARPRLPSSSVCARRRDPGPCQRPLALVQLAAPLPTHPHRIALPCACLARRVSSRAAPSPCIPLRVRSPIQPRLPLRRPSPPARAHPGRPRPLTSLCSSALSWSLAPSRVPPCRSRP